MEPVHGHATTHRAALVALAALSILLMLFLVGPGPGGSNEAALWGFMLAPLGGVAAFASGLGALSAGPPAPRLGWARMLSGAGAMATPGVLSSVYLLQSGARPPFDLWSALSLYVPLLGGVVFAGGALWLRRATLGATAPVPTIATVRRTVWLGAALLSATWLFGLFALVDITFGGD